MGDGPNEDFNKGHNGIVFREETPSGVLYPFTRKPIVKSLCIYPAGLARMIKAKSLLRKSLLTKSLVKSTSFHEEPDYCHTFSSKTGALSQRTCASAGAHQRWSLSETVSWNTTHNRTKHAHCKRAKQHDKLLALLTFSS